MEEEKTKLNNGMKILGASLLFLAIPGSMLAIPYMIYKFKKSNKEKKSNFVLGI